MKKFSKRILALILFGTVVFGDSQISYAMTAAPPGTGVVTTDNAEETLDKLQQTSDYRFSIMSDTTPVNCNNAGMIKNGNVYVLSYKDKDAKDAAMSYYKDHGYKVFDDNTVDSLSSENVEVKSEATKESPIDNAVTDNPQKEQSLVEKITDDKTVTVAVIDSGIDGTDEAFKDRLSDKTENSDKTDENGHGTLVSKIILADADPYTKILPIKTFDKDGNASAINVYFAIERAIEAKVDIINLSAVGAGENDLIKKAVDDAEKAKIPIVVAAGNYSADVSSYFPSCYDYPYVIASTTDGTTVSSDSDYGDKVDFVVNGSVEDKDNVYSGTSFAAARFSGYLTNIVSYDRDNKISDIKFVDDKTVTKEIGLDMSQTYIYLDKEQIKKMTQQSSDKTASDTTASDTKNKEDQTSKTPKDTTPTDGLKVIEVPNGDGTADLSLYDTNMVLQANRKKTKTFTVSGIKANGDIAIYYHKNGVTNWNNDHRVIEVLPGESKSAFWSNGINNLGGTISISWDNSDTARVAFNEVNCWGQTPFIRCTPGSYPYHTLPEPPFWYGPDTGAGCDTAGANDDGLNKNWLASDGYAWCYVGLNFASDSINFSWQPWIHTVNYNAGSVGYDTGCNGLPSDFTRNADYRYWISGSPTRSGYAFQGYDASIGGKYYDGTEYTHQQNGSNVTMTAQWSIINYPIHLSTWGGSTEWVDHMYNIEQVFDLPTPTKPGFEFRGWTGNDVSDPSLSVTVSHQTGSRTYTAHWATKLKLHTNTSLMNGYLLNNEKGYGETNLTSSAYISGAQSSESNNTSDPVATLYEGTNYNINSAVNVKYNDKDINNSFIFAGWNTSPDGSGTWYGDRDSNGNYARVSGKTATGQFSWYGDVAGVDLYAQYYVKANLTYSGNHQTNSAKDYTTTINAGLIKNYGSFYFNKNTFERIEYATSFDAYEQADINKRYPYSYHGWSIDSNAYFKDARVYQPSQNVNTLNYIYECFQYGGENNINIQNGYVTITTYAVWDKYPVFTNKQDVSYPTDTVPNLTADEINSDILKNIRVEDREDTASIYDNREIQYVKVLDVDLNELKSFKTSTTVSATIEVKDSAGNISHTRVNIILNKSTSGDVSEDPDIYNAYVTRYVRSISKDYIDKSHEDGGLLKDSIWRTDPSYKQTLKEAVDENTTPEQTFYISNQTRNEIRDFVNKNGIGNAVHGDALIRFNDEFKEKFKVKPKDKSQK